MNVAGGEISTEVTQYRNGFVGYTLCECKPLVASILLSRFFFMFFCVFFLWLNDCAIPERNEPQAKGLFISGIGIWKKIQTKQYIYVPIYPSLTPLIHCYLPLYSSEISFAFTKNAQL